MVVSAHIFIFFNMGIHYVVGIEYENMIKMTILINAILLTLAKSVSFCKQCKTHGIV
jgi:hypothetical protein